MELSFRIKFSLSRKLSGYEVRNLAKPLNDDGKTMFLFFEIYDLNLGTYEGVFTNEMLCQKWEINPEELEFVNSNCKVQH